MSSVSTASSISEIILQAVEPLLALTDSITNEEKVERVRRLHCWTDPAVPVSMIPTLHEMCVKVVLEVASAKDIDFIKQYILIQIDDVVQKYRSPTISSEGSAPPPPPADSPPSIRGLATEVRVLALSVGTLVKKTELVQENVENLYGVIQQDRKYMIELQAQGNATSQALLASLDALHGVSSSEK